MALKRGRTPLLDFSGGRLRGWPGGSVIYPDERGEVFTFRPPRKDESLPNHAEVHQGGFGRWTYCKYCYRSVLPLALHEFLLGQHHRMMICSRCGSGLAPSEQVS